MKKTFNIQYFERIRKNHIHALQPAYRKYILFPNDNAVTSCLINGSIYEPYYFDFISDNLISLDGMTIIDVGANNGHFTVEFAQYVGDTGKVHSFEPQRIIFQQLCGNVFLNGLDNVHTYNVALGDKLGVTYVEKPNYFDSGYVNFGDVHILDSENENVEKVEIKNSALVLYKEDVTKKYDLRTLHNHKQTKSHTVSKSQLNAGKSVVVKNGDSLYKIAKRNNTTVAAICKKNGFKTNKVLKPGMRIKV
jgi:FkbM family methyltransferase